MVAPNLQTAERFFSAIGLTDFVLNLPNGCESDLDAFRPKSQQATSASRVEIVLYYSRCASD